ncbi:unnamed protein product [Clavelina lepadiformis]|uniref:non-specific serine/threonine protein kinase n=1 Tax=Clavelina lepadiformis TaxID=159417 RepID=A0ABP0FJQ9_CLALP
MKFSTVVDDVTRTLKDLNSTDDHPTNDDEEAELDETTFPHYKRVSDYLLGTCIGEGSFAKVRVGLHRPTKEKVAVKVINKTKAKKDSYVYRNLHREGKIMQMIQHPNIVQVYDILETGNNYYLVTELCTGGELIDIVSEKGSLPESTVRKYMYQLVNAVAYLHGRKIVHRDLKVENLLLDSDDNLKIIDFGLSNTVSPHCSDISSSLATQCGSPAYAAPELLSKRTYGPKVDVWSIGVITYALLVGKLPFTVEPFHIPKLCKKMLRGEMNPIPSFISSQCRFFIRKLLSPDYVNRPSISDVIKLKWISSYQADVRKSSTRHSVPSLLIGRMSSETNQGRRLSGLLPLSSAPIDASVVKEMEASFGFISAEVFQCVQKNQPGPVLATYHLLLRKRKSPRRKSSSRYSRSIQTHIENKINDRMRSKKNDVVIPTSHCQQSATDSGSSPATEDGLSLTPPLSNIRTPDNLDISSNDSKAKANVDNVTDEEICVKKYQPSSSPTFKMTSTSERRSTDRFKENSTSKGLPQPTFAEDPDNGINKVSESKIEVEESLKFKNDIKDHQEEKELNSYKSPANIFNDESLKRPEINEMLATMKKARQVLQRRQEVHQRNRLNLNKPAEQEKATTQNINRLTSDPAGRYGSRVSPRFSRKSLPTRKSDLGAIEPRSSSQQGNQTQDSSILTTRSPLHRPVSHNSITSRLESKFLGQRHFIYTPSSPNSPRYSPNWLKSNHSSEKSNRVNKSTAPASGQHNAPTTLPVIVPKAIPELSPPKQVAHKAANGHPHLVRRSLPASQNHVDVSTNKVSPHHTFKPDPLNRNGRSVDVKGTTVVSRWQSSKEKEPKREHFVNKSPYGYYVTKKNEAPVVTQKPRKVISEPIAAAISYLTSTKNRGFRKDQTGFNRQGKLSKIKI